METEDHQNRTIEDRKSNYHFLVGFYRDGEHVGRKESDMPPFYADVNGRKCQVFVFTPNDTNFQISMRAIKSF